MTDMPKMSWRVPSKNKKFADKNWLNHNGYIGECQFLI